ncbi:pentapeptide repeat-containing protein [Propionibacteriaceae bacterium Y1685]
MNSPVAPDCRHPADRGTGPGAPEPGGAGLAGTDLAGTDLAGTDLAGTDLGGTGADWARPSLLPVVMRPRPTPAPASRCR